MSRDPEELAPRFARVLGGLILANVLVEAALSALVGNPTQPPFATPEARFQLAGGIVPRLVEIVAGAGLLTAAWWGAGTESAPKARRAQRRVGWTFLLFAGLALLPLIMLVQAFADYNVTGMPPAGQFRFRMQFGRTLVFYLTAAVALGTFGRLLVARSRAARAAADSPA